MPQFVEPRVIRLSWRPPNDSAGVPVGEWIARLKKRLKVFRRDTAGRDIVLQDLAEVGADRAAVRDGPWTDFVAVYTIDYCLSCDAEGDASEIHDALRRRGEPCHLLWLVRLEPGNPSDSVIGEIEPWRDVTGWQVLPDPDPEVPPLSTQPHTIDADLQSKCVERLRALSPRPATGEPDVPGV